MRLILDGSLGFHNQEKAMAYVAEALKLGEQAEKANSRSLLRVPRPTGNDGRN